MQSLISIIIPVFNARQYLRSCLDSVLAQTWSPVEVILVDDGSTDADRQILAEYAQRYPDLRILHQDNGGVSRARNAGLNIAQGEFVLFCDSDDLLAPSALEQMYTQMQKADSDLCCCAFSIFQQQDQIDFSAAGSCSVWEKNEIYWQILGQNGYACNKMFRRSLIEAEPAVRFCDDIAILEDELFVVEYLQRCRRICALDARLYGYRQHGGSVLHQSFSAKKLTQMTALERIYTLIEQTGDSSLMREAWNRLMRTYAVCNKKLLFSSIESKSLWKENIKTGFHRYKGKYPMDGDWTKKEKLYYLLLCISAGAADRKEN